MAITFEFSIEFKEISHSEYLNGNSKADSGGTWLFIRSPQRSAHHRSGAYERLFCAFGVIYDAVCLKGRMFSIKELRRTAGVSRSSYCAWVKAAAVGEHRERSDFEKISEVCKKHGYKKGAEGICMALIHMNPPVIMNLKKLRRLMDKYNIRYHVQRANSYRRNAKELKTGNFAYVEAPSKGI